MRMRNTRGALETETVQSRAMETKVSEVSTSSRWGTKGSRNRGMGGTDSK